MASKRVAMIEVYYPGNVISVNHYLGRTREGGTFVKKEAQAWMDSIGWQLKQFHIEGWKLPLKITLSGVFKDKRSCPDLHNCVKCACDAVEEVTDLNDKNYRTETEEPRIDPKREPKIWLKIEEG